MNIQRCGEDVAEYIHAQLREYNKRFLTDCESIHFCIRDDAGHCVAGIVSSRDLDCITVDYLFVDEMHRGKGYGAMLLDHLEKQASCMPVKRILLNTFSFQAPGFYEKMGYRLFGKVEPCLNEYGQYFYVKELESK
jgi:GNAT superfamily N-acetyltransferase